MKKNKRSLKFTAAGLAATFLICSTIAQADTQSRHGDDIIIAVDRVENEQAALQIHAAYTADIWYNDGGAENGWRYLDNLDVTAELDLERAIGWKGATAFIYGLYNNGHSLSELTGDGQTVSNIETGEQAVRLYEAWIEQEFGASSSVKIGLFDLNSEFDALETSSLFINSAHGIGSDIAQTGENGPSIFPVTSLAVRIQTQMADGLTVRAAILDGVPGDPDLPSRTIIKLNDGALVIGELDWISGNSRILAGAWGYSKKQDRLDGSDKSTSNGYYLRGETLLHEGVQGNISAFARIGVASDDVHPYGFFLSGGVAAEFGEKHMAGLAVAHARSSDISRSLLADPDLTLETETAIELTLASQISKNLSIQPSIQYIINPGASKGLPDALAVGMRASVGF